MKALVFRHSLAREAASAIGGQVDELPLPGSDWVRVETTFSGLCGGPVPDGALGVDQVRPITGQLAPKVGDIGGHDRAGPAEVIVPHVVEQLGTSAHPGGQLLQPERLGDVVVAADGEPGDLVVLGASQVGERRVREICKFCVDAISGTAGHAAETNR